MADKSEKLEELFGVPPQVTDRIRASVKRHSKAVIALASSLTTVLALRVISSSSHADMRVL